MFERRRARKQLEAAAPLAEDTPDGVLARVTGVVRAVEWTLKAPLSGRTCVAFAVRVTEPNGHDGGSFSNAAEFDCVDLVPFAIEAAGHKIIIDSEFADIVMPAHQLASVDDAAWTDFCDARRLSPVSAGVETPLIVGTTVTVVGTTLRRMTAPGRDIGYRESPSQLCLVGDFDHPLLIIDDDGRTSWA